MLNTIETREDYWAGFYSAQHGKGAMQPPSQFAAFVAQELAPRTTIIDAGCGNGRDSLFFAALGYNVVAFDQSESAIGIVRKKAADIGCGHLTCAVGEISGRLLRDTIAACSSARVCVYARFFLHAITESEQAAFFDALAESMKAGDRIAFEYRTTADQFLEKTAPPHYRRYQSAKEVNTALEYLGFKVLYETEGQGFAKYRDEDAIVARVILEKAKAK